MNPSRAAARRIGALPPTIRGTLWMLLTLLGFASMAIAGRELSSSMSTFELLFWRSLIGAGILLAIGTAMRGGLRLLRTDRLLGHFARNVVHFLGQYGYFFALGVLPLAQCVSISFTMPIFGVALAVLVLRERPSWARLAALGLGFGGILLILRPGAVPLEIGALIALGGSLCYGASTIMVKSLTRTESASAIVFFMQVMQLPMGLVPALLDWSGPSGWDWLWLVIVGGAGLVAHYGMARAMALADATLVLPVYFLQLPFLSVLAFVIYGEVPVMWTLIGAGVICAGTWLNVWWEGRGSARSAAG